MHKGALFKFLGILSFLLLSIGCQQYHLCTHVPIPFTSIYILPVKNDTYIPQAQALLTNQLRQLFICEGAIDLKDPDTADAILTVSLQSYKQEGNSVQELDTTEFSSIKLKLTAKCSLVNNHNQKIYFRDQIVEITLSTAVNDAFQGSVHQLMPTLTEMLAQEISSKVMSIWTGPEYL